MRISARVPATSANLGPGFDCFGLALDLCNEVTVDTQAEPGVSWEGECAGELPTDGSDLVSRAMTVAAERAAGVRATSLPPVHLHAVNRIPVERGLGSSAAAIVAGLVLADRLLGTGLSADRILELAVELEGHADNVAAALYGGVTIAFPTGSGWAAESLALSAGVRPVILVPEQARLPTAAARKALPEMVPLADAAFNVGRSALLVLALTKRPDLLESALVDRLHQDARLSLVPPVREAFDRLRGAGVPVCISGAGPSLLAFERGEQTLPDPGPGWRVLRVPVRATGVEVL